jgi:hypothetical protein
MVRWVDARDGKHRWRSASIMEESDENNEIDMN